MVRFGCDSVTSAGPKRGCLNVGAWNPQASGRKAPLFCNAVFSMLRCSFSLAAVQPLVKMTSALQESQCYSATSAAQHSETAAQLRFRWWHVAGVGFRGVGFSRQEASITWCDLFWPKFGQKMPKIISLHDVLEPLKQALLASRDVIISSRICGSNLRKVFTLGDGCWLPI